MARLNYYGKDFYTIVEELKDYIKSNYPEYTNLFDSDMGIMLIEAIAYGLDTMSFYLDKSVEEAFLDTAKSPKSIERLARQLGYKIRPANASISNVNIQFETTYGFPITFYKGYLFNGGGLEFEVDTDIIINSVDTSRTYQIPVREGRSVVEYFVSNGQKNQSFTLTKIPEGKFLAKHIENTTSEIEVYVNNVKWNYRDFIAYDDENCFEIEYSNPPVLRFGGYKNQIPPAGAEIRVKYHYCSGKLGNLLANQIIGKSSLIINNTNILFKIVGSDTCTGGEDIEDINLIKQNIPYYYKSRGLAITQSDYDYILKNLGVAKAKAISVRDLAGEIPFSTNLYNINYLADQINSSINNSNLSDNEKKSISDLLIEIKSNVNEIEDNLDEIISNDCKANVIEIYVLNKNANGEYVSPSSYHINNIKAQLENIVEPTVDIVILDGMNNSLVVDLKIDLEVKQGFDTTYVSDLVIQAVKNIFNSLEFGQSLYLGDIYEKIESIAGVEHSNINILNVWYNAKLSPIYRQLMLSRIVNGNVIIKKNEFLILGNLIINLV